MHGNYLPGPVWELLARSSVGTTCQVQCANYLPGPVWNNLPGPVWELVARSSIGNYLPGPVLGTTCQVQCGNYLPGPVWELLARSSIGNYLPGPVWELLARSSVELLARSSVGTTCQVQCWDLLARPSVGTYLPGPVLGTTCQGTTCQVQCGTTCQVQCGNYLPGPVLGPTCQVQCWDLLARSSVEHAAKVWWDILQIGLFGVFSSFLSSCPSHLSLLLQLLYFFLSYIYLPWTASIFLHVPTWPPYLCPT